MQIGEQHQARAQQLVLGGLRLLDLHHEVGPAPDIGGGVYDLRAELFVLRVGKRALFTGSRFDEHLMPSFNQRSDSARNQAYASLVILDFLRNANDHGLDSGFPANWLIGSRLGPRPSAISESAAKLAVDSEILVFLEFLQRRDRIRAPHSVHRTRVVSPYPQAPVGFACSVRQSAAIWRGADRLAVLLPCLPDFPLTATDFFRDATALPLPLDLLVFADAETPYQAGKQKNGTDKTS